MGKANYCPQCGNAIKENWKFCQFCGTKIESTNNGTVLHTEEKNNSSQDKLQLNSAMTSKNIFDNLIEHVAGVKTYKITPNDMCKLVYYIYLKNKPKEVQYSILKKIRGLSGYFGNVTNTLSDDGRYNLYVGHIHRGYMFGIRRNIWIKDMETDICYEIGKYEHSKLKNGVKLMVEQGITPEKLPIQLKKDSGLVPILVCIFIVLLLFLILIESFNVSSANQKEKSENEVASHISEEDIANYISENNDGSFLSKYIEIEAMDFCRNKFSKDISLDYTLKNISPVDIEKISFNVYLYDEQLSNMDYFNVSTSKINKEDTLEGKSVHTPSFANCSKIEIENVTVYLSNGEEIDCILRQQFDVNVYTPQIDSLNKMAHIKSLAKRLENSSDNEETSSDNELQIEEETLSDIANFEDINSYPDALTYVQNICSTGRISRYMYYDDTYPTIECLCESRLDTNGNIIFHVNNGRYEIITLYAPDFNKGMMISNINKANHNRNIFVDYMDSEILSIYYEEDDVKYYIDYQKTDSNN